MWIVSVARLPRAATRRLLPRMVVRVVVTVGRTFLVLIELLIRIRLVLIKIHLYFILYPELDFSLYHHVNNKLTNDI